MKNMKRLLLVLALGLTAIAYVNAQDLEGTLRAGPEDASKYLENYMEPAILSFANGLSNGWVNTAKTHKILGLDLTVAVNLASVPDEAASFAYGSEDSWTNLILISGDGDLPTLVGGDGDSRLALKTDAVISDGQGHSITYTAESEPFDAAPGIDYTEGIPTPTVHLGVGLMKNTDLKIRYVPSISTEKLEFDMFGIGVMHDIKQWIPSLKLVPIDIAAFFGTTSMNVKIATDIDQPTITVDDGSGNLIEVPDNTDVFYTIGDASTEFKVSSTTIQVLASKKLSVLTPYISIGYNIVSSNLDVKGTYRYTNDLGASVDLVNPISLEFGEGNSPRATIGAQLKLLILTLHADYTFQNYNTFTAGVGISIR
ncbi:MAG: hypothetical protein GY816_02930 [Cytophagales bacterium]|nr:hypothetical protein [Cytophagales bacterium]